MGNEMSRDDIQSRLFKIHNILENLEEEEKASEMTSKSVSVTARSSTHKHQISRSYNRRDEEEILENDNESISEYT